MTKKSLTNYGKIYWNENVKDGEKERVYVMVDRSHGEIVKFTSVFRATDEFVIIGYVDIIQESWMSDWDTTYWKDYTSVLYDHMEKIGAMEYDEEGWPRLV